MQLYEKLKGYLSVLLNPIRLMLTAEHRGGTTSQHGALSLMCAGIKVLMGGICMEIFSPGNIYSVHTEADAAWQYFFPV